MSLLLLLRDDLSAKGPERTYRPKIDNSMEDELDRWVFWGFRPAQLGSLTRQPASHPGTGNGLEEASSLLKQTACVCSAVQAGCIRRRACCVDACQQLPAAAAAQHYDNRMMGPCVAALQVGAAQEGQHARAYGGAARGC